MEQVADTFAIFTDAAPEATPEVAVEQPVEQVEAPEVEESVEEAPEESVEQVAEETVEEQPSSPDFLNQLKEYGILGDDVSLDDAPDAILLKIEEEVNHQVDGILNDLKEKHGEEARDLVQFLMNGGKVDDYLKLYGDKPLSSFDINTELGQEQFLRHSLAQEGKTAEEIDDLMEYYQERDVVGKNATIAYNRAKEKQDAQRREQLTKAAEQKAAKEAAARQMREQTKNAILNVEKIGELPVTPTQRRVMAQYITQPTVKLPDGTHTSRFAADMQNLIQTQPSGLALVADVVRSLVANGDVSKSNLGKYLQSEVTKATKKTINSKPKSSPRSDDPFAEWM